MKPYRSERHAALDVDFPPAVYPVDFDRRQLKRPDRRELVAASPWEKFWPEGWLIWFCFFLGSFDVAMVGFIIKQIGWH